MPERLLVIGGGIIGLEMATVYHALGAKVTIVELMDQIIPGADKDIVTPLMKRIEKHYEAIYLKTKVTKVEAKPEGLVGAASRAAARPPPTRSTGSWSRSAGGPNGKADRRRERRRRASTSAASSRSTSRCAPTCRTSSPSATSSASRCWRTRRCTRARSRPRRPPGTKSCFDAKVIPSVAYTDPEVAWVGLTENEAKAQGHQIRQGRLPLGGQRAARCRSAATRADQAAVRRGDPPPDRLRHRRPECRRPHRRGGARHRDGRRRRRYRAHHPSAPDACRRPIGMAAEMFEGTITDLIAPKKKH